MPTVSVKLPEATKERIDRLAASKGTSPHALMVEAIEAKLESEETHDAFLQAALQSRGDMLVSGKAYDGDEFLAYAMAKLRGETSVRPRLKSIKTLLKSPK